MILFNFATRSRPAKMLATFESIIKFYPNAKVLFKIDLDDLETINSNAYYFLSSYPNVKIALGTSISKIHAINRDIPDTGWDVLVNISDDMIINSYHDIEADFNSLDQFIHYPDGRLNELLPTMSIMGKDYYNRFGFVYHFDYVSLWSDNEAMDVAKILNKYKYINIHFFTHNHPIWTKGIRDALGKECDRYYYADEKMYRKRKEKNFDL